MQISWKVQPAIAARMKDYYWGDVDRNRKQAGKNKSLLTVWASQHTLFSVLSESIRNPAGKIEHVDSIVSTPASQSNVFKRVSLELWDSNLITTVLCNEVLDFHVIVAAGVTQICLQFGWNIN